MPYDLTPATVVADVGSGNGNAFGVPAVRGQVGSASEAVYALTQASQDTANLVPTLQSTASGLITVATTGVSQISTAMDAVTSLYGEGDQADAMNSRLSAVGDTFSSLSGASFGDQLQAVSDTTNAFPAALTSALSGGTVTNAATLLSGAMAPLGEMSTALSDASDSLSGAATSLGFVSAHTQAVYGPIASAPVTSAISDVSASLTGVVAGTSSLLSGVTSLTSSLTNIASSGTASLSMFGSGSSLISSLFSGDSDTAGLFTSPSWGVFTQGGGTVLAADSVVSVDFRREYRVSDYPVEQGGFQSYNKVQVPFDARVTFAIASSWSARSAFLSSLETAIKSLDFYKVVTPEATYQSANLIHMDYRREQRRGINLLVVDVWLEEVRVTAKASYSTSDAQADSSQPKQNDGPVQATSVAGTSTSFATSGPTSGGTATGGLATSTGAGSGDTSTVGSGYSQTLSFGDENTGGVSPYESTMPSEGAVTQATTTTELVGHGTGGLTSGGTGTGLPAGQTPATSGRSQTGPSTGGGSWWKLW